VNLLVSIVIPTYNRAEEVPNAIDSVLAQTYRPIEVIVVDDGSTDDTRAVLAAYGDAIRVIRQANAGCSAARNEGIRIGNGELIGFLDSDDTWRPRKLQIQVRLLRAAGPSVLCCLGNSVEHYPDGKSVADFDFWRFRPRRAEGILDNPTLIFLSRFLLFNPTALIRRRAFAVAGMYDETLQVMEDHDLALRLSLTGPWAYTTEPLTDVRRATPYSLTTTATRNGRMLREHMVRLYEGLLADDVGLSARERRLAEKRLAAERKALDEACRPSRPKPIRRFMRRVHGAIWRRSPWYPQPRVRPLPESCDAMPRRGVCKGSASWKA